MWSSEHTGSVLRSGFPAEKILKNDLNGARARLADTHNIAFRSTDATLFCTRLQFSEFRGGVSSVTAGFVFL